MGGVYIYDGKYQYGYRANGDHYLRVSPSHCEGVRHSGSDAICTRASSVGRSGSKDRVRWKIVLVPGARGTMHTYEVWLTRYNMVWYDDTANHSDAIGRRTGKAATPGETFCMRKNGRRITRSQPRFTRRIPLRTCGTRIRMRCSCTARMTCRRRWKNARRV